MDSESNSRPILKPAEPSRAAIDQDGSTHLNAGSNVIAPQPYNLPARTGRSGFSGGDMIAGLLAALIIWCPLLAGAIHGG